MELYEEIGGRIREAREAVGLSQEQLGKKLGNYSGTAISYFESGSRKVKIEDLHKLSEILQRPVDYFLYGEAGNRNDRPKAEVLLRSQQRRLSPPTIEKISEFIEFAKQQKGKED